ncbi:hypothetical protein V9L05_01710 [Bernardetia sp. Wsw4-3y2]|uniref:hypothetical protein n=1 Tax=Bernardetia sp. Wsw4-3y2 TaxID=3127471 RepID=UPI0030D5172D
MFFKKIFTRPKIEREKLEVLKEIASKFENQIFTESNYDFMYDELKRFNSLANVYIKQTNKVVCKDLCMLQIAHQKRGLDRDVLENEEENNRIPSQYFFETMIKVIDFILLKYEVKE